MLGSWRVSGFAERTLSVVIGNVNISCGLVVKKLTDHVNVLAFTFMRSRTRHGALRHCRRVWEAFGL